MNKLTIPNLLEVDRTDGTFVMDCDSGIALVAIHRDELAARKARKAATESEQDAALELAPKSKSNRN
jgi:hypothetical protein